MRNLKKILAMVLALVMSLSLMATAGAADFADASSINDTYETAIEVLSGLGVFNGYKEDGTFRPQGSITRAETAAIIYRIVTGDVNDEQVGIYADYNLFTDVPSTSWYAGYVNYCANAEYIKGLGNGKFDPQGQVTGYAALAMILRAIGYTANGGFTGSDWAVQTARTAEARKITKNITSGTLGLPANRETVAEILFQAILVNMVDHNVLNTLNGNQGYTEIDMTLGYKTFKLEQIEGVVVANEYADLYSGQVLSDGRTNLEVAEDDIRSLAITTEITDIGESRYAYITGSKVLAMGDTGLNTVTEFGHACDITTTSKFNEVAEMPAASDIEFYSNFQLTTEGDYYCDQRLEFSVVFYGQSAENAFDGYKGIDISVIAANDRQWSVEYLTGVDENGDDVWCPVRLGDHSDYDNATQYIDADGNFVDYNYSNYTYPVRYTKIIWAGENITDTDLLVLESIFGTADNVQNNVLLKNRITGDVFVGTKSTNTSTDEERDLSNTISFKKFREDYIKGDAEYLSWGTTENGFWTKFIDNDGDGKCDYAFRTVSWLDEALYTYTNRNGDTVTEFYNFDDNTYDQIDTNRYTVRYLNGYTPALGDKVIAARIDNQILVEPADDVTATVSAYSWRNDEITTDKGTYGQSGIINGTNMMDRISAMDDGIEYIMYLDHFGYVRAYELPGGNTYALLTELYYTNAQQGNLVDNWPMTVELTMPNADGEAVTDEYNVVGGAATFTAKEPWMRVANAVATYNYNNWLQPAIGALGVTLNPYAPTKGIPAFSALDSSNNDDIGPNAYSTFWNANRQLVRNIALNGMNGRQEFNYGAQTVSKLYKNVDGSDYTWNVNATASFTNVAVVDVDGNNVSLFGAAQLNRDRLGAVVDAQPYSVNYIQLSIADADAQAVRYPIHSHTIVDASGNAVLDSNGDPINYAAANNYYVNAVHDTEYFIAYNGGVHYVKDFVNFPGLTMDENVIHAAYAVARNTNSDVNGAPYWVADVIVYEVYALDDIEEQTSVSLAYYTPERLSNTVQQLDTLNSKYGPEVTLTPGGKAWNSTSGQWGVTWGWADAYGFYRLYNDTEPVDNVMTASSIKRIGLGEYAENRIYAGYVEREAYLSGNGYYIDVNMGNGKIASIEVTDKIYSITQQSAQTTSGYRNVATALRYVDSANKQVLKGDLVIWINDGAVKASSMASTGTLNSTKFVVDLGGLTSLDRVYAGVSILVDTPSWLVNYYWDNATSQYVINTPAVTSSGEWQKIMYEQTGVLADNSAEKAIADANALLARTDLTLDDVDALTAALANLIDAKTLDKTTVSQVTEINGLITDVEDKIAEIRGENLAELKLDAIASIEKEIADAGLEIADVQSEYDAAVAAIEGCADFDALDALMTNEASGAVKNLRTAIADALAAAGTAADKAEAMDAARDAVDNVTADVLETASNLVERTTIEATAAAVSKAMEARMAKAATVAEVEAIQEWAEGAIEDSLTPATTLDRSEDSIVTYFDDDTNTMYLLKNVDLAGNYVTFGNGENADVEVLDLGGLEITSSTENRTIAVYQKLEIVNGTVSFTPSESNAGAAIYLYDGADVTIGEDAVVEKTGTWGYAVAVSGTSGCDAKLTVNGTLRGYNGMTVSGNIYPTSGIVITVNGTAKIEGTAFHGMYLSGVATTTIKEGAEITGATTGIEIRMGSLKVEGGTISTPHQPAEYGAITGGTSTEGCGIGINPYYDNVPVSVGVLGGTIQGYHAIGVANALNRNDCVVRVSVTSNATLLNDMGAPGKIYNYGPAAWEVELDGVKVEPIEE